jgi:hypothetical protein
VKNGILTAEAQRTPRKIRVSKFETFPLRVLCASVVNPGLSFGCDLAAYDMQENS